MLREDDLRAMRVLMAAGEDFKKFTGKKRAATIVNQVQ